MKKRIYGIVFVLILLMIVGVGCSIDADNIEFKTGCIIAAVLLCVLCIDGLLLRLEVRREDNKIRKD